MSFLQRLGMLGRAPLSVAMAAAMAACGDDKKVEQPANSDLSQAGNFIDAWSASETERYTFERYPNYVDNLSRAIRVQKVIEERHPNPSSADDINTMKWARENLQSSKSDLEGVEQELLKMSEKIKKQTPDAQKTALHRLREISRDSSSEQIGIDRMALKLDQNSPVIEPDNQQSFREVMIAFRWAVDGLHGRNAIKTNIPELAAQKEEIEKSNAWMAEEMVKTLVTSVGENRGMADQVIKAAEILKGSDLPTLEPAWTVAIARVEESLQQVEAPAQGRGGR